MTGTRREARLGLGLALVIGGYMLSIVFGTRRVAG